MKVRAAIVSSCALALAGGAWGQSQRLVYSQDNLDFDGYGPVPTAPDIAVSGLAVVFCGNAGLELYSRTTTLPAPGPLDERVVPLPSPTSPFALSDTNFQFRFIDPRATYDAANDRLWVAYLETAGTKPAGECTDVSKLHLSISKDPSQFPPPGALDSLGTTHWWYYTGPTDRMVTPTTGSFDLRFANPPSETYRTYKNETASNGEFGDAARMATIAVDGTRASGRGAAFVTPNRFEFSCDSGSNSPVPNEGLESSVLIIPLEHKDLEGNTLSILEGDRPDETDIILLNFWSSPLSGETDRVADFSEAPYLVQEPFEVYDNAAFLISGISDRTVPGRQDAIRLKGFFYDDQAPAGEEWTLQQRVSAGGTTLEDIDLNDDPNTLSNFVFHPTPPIASAPRPRTPDSPTGGWGPAAEGYIFHSAVLCKDVNNNDRIFAVHTVFPDDPTDPTEPGTAIGKWVVQWYVIDPDLADFRNTPAPAPSWDPVVVARGRLDAGEADRYHPVIVVNRQGQAFIEYTYSDEADPAMDDTWPEIRRVRLDSTYTGIVGSETVVRSGPPVPYEEGVIPPPPGIAQTSWSNYAGAQADPFNNCAYWSTHTLVTDPGMPVPPDNDERDVWLFHQAYGNATGPCPPNQSMLDLNDDNEVDAFDAAAFTPLYDRRARRVDIDGSGTVDAIDMALYFDAFDAYTRGR